MCKGKNGSFDDLDESDTDSSVSMDSASDTDEEDDSPAEGARGDIHALLFTFFS